ncbi:MAG TPA: GNAT family N-acetyltransferase, partial [Longimicrobiaceae bacterium]|nr:GNAT family N-acetyltransferase [Longimicrobiaceae bacterium]
MIRAAAPGDAPRLAELVTALGYPCGAEAMAARLARLLAHPDHHTLVAEAEGRVVGLAGLLRGLSFTHDGPYVRVVSLVVDPECRGRRHGAALLRAAEAWAREVGAESMHLTTGAHRTRTHEFYRRQGFDATGLRFYKRLE